MRIYVITHKTFKSIKTSSIYVPLLVGEKKNIATDIFLKDDSNRDNIADKNSSFCELTGAYWIWKTSREDIVGICHYRRYFCDTKYILKKYTVLSEHKIRNTLKQYDIILPAKDNYEYNNKPAKVFFAEMHDVEVWNNCRKIIELFYPEYLSDFEWFEKETAGYCYNMMIVRKDLFDDYHEWLFNILFKLEKLTDINKYKGYNTRMFGFMSERLLNVWVHHKNLRIKEKYIYNTDSPKLYKKVEKRLKKILERNRKN